MLPLDTTRHGGKTLTKKRIVAGLAAIVAALTIVAAAAANDCIRVSGSYQGLVNSTKSGNWLLFDLSSTSGVDNSIGQFFPLQDGQDECIVATYGSYGLPPYFALGIGIAGTDNGGPGVLAWHNKNEQLFGNLKGIDHLDASPIGLGLRNSILACTGIDIFAE